MKTTTWIIVGLALVGVVLFFFQRARDSAESTAQRNALLKKVGQSPAELILGVGQAEKIDRLTVRWPTGQEDVFTDLPVEAVISIVEGEAGYTVHSQEWMPANSRQHP